VRSAATAVGRAFRAKSLADVRLLSLMLDAIYLLLAARRPKGGRFRRLGLPASASISVIRNANA